MRIGCLQFAPQVGDVDNNLNRADAVLSRANPDDLDLLVLPELAFSGKFKSHRNPPKFHYMRLIHFPRVQLQISSRHYALSRTFWLRYYVSLG